MAAIETETMNTSSYSDLFYEEHRQESFDSADVVVPWVLELIAPNSVVDVGCGVGTWLSVFRKYGISDLVGLDGAWVNSESLEIPPKDFHPLDICKPTGLGRQFDLVMSLEVAEHLAPDAAESFIAYLTSLGDVVLFSAAIPEQGGTGHSNEQWPDYWTALFQKNGYRCVDCFRGSFWTSDRVAPWYIQNSFFFIKEDCLQSYQTLLELESRVSLGHRSVVHPALYMAKANAIRRLSDPKSYSIKEFARAFPTLLSRAIRLRLKAS